MSATTSEKSDCSETQSALLAEVVPIDWKAIVAEHQVPRRWAACWQIVTSLGAYLAMWCIMYRSLSVSWWLTMPLALLTGGFLVRVFIIFHDCGHGSFFKSRLANDVWGFVTGMMSFTPYHHWRWEHAVHHATNGDLDRRGLGDIWTMTVSEYLAASRWMKLAYRLVRHPLVLFGIGPFFMFVIRERFSTANAKPRDKASVWIMNVAILSWSAVLISYFGFMPWLIIQSTVMAVGASAGVWLFYVQHQYEDAHWQRSEDWDFLEAAIKGSSYYKLPRILQWFAGNIGFHHIHHLSSRIPNYNLERCHYSHPMFSEVKPLTLWASFKSMHYRLWDEENMKLITFRQLKQQLRAQAAGG